MAERLQCRVTANMQTSVCVGQEDWWLTHPTIEGWTKYTAILKQLTLALSVSQGSSSIVAFWTCLFSPCPPIVVDFSAPCAWRPRRELGHLIQKGPGAFMAFSSKDSYFTISQQCHNKRI